MNRLPHILNLKRDMRFINFVHNFFDQILTKAKSSKKVALDSDIDSFKKKGKLFEPKHSSYTRSILQRFNDSHNIAEIVTTLTVFYQFPYYCSTNKYQHNPLIYFRMQKIHSNTGLIEITGHYRILLQELLQRYKSSSIDDSVILFKPHKQCFFYDTDQKLYYKRHPHSQWKENQSFIKLLLLFDDQSIPLSTKLYHLGQTLIETTMSYPLESGCSQAVLLGLIYPLLKIATPSSQELPLIKPQIDLELEVLFFLLENSIHGQNNFCLYFSKGVFFQKNEKNKVYDNLIISQNKTGDESINVLVNNMIRSQQSPSFVSMHQYLLRNRLLVTMFSQQIALYQNPLILAAQKDNIKTFHFLLVYCDVALTSKQYHNTDAQYQILHHLLDIFLEKERTLEKPSLIYDIYLNYLNDSMILEEVLNTYIQKQQGKTQERLKLLTAHLKSYHNLKSQVFEKKVKLNPSYFSLKQDPLPQGAYKDSKSAKRNSSYNPKRQLGIIFSNKSNDNDCPSKAGHLKKGIS